MEGQRHAQRGLEYLDAPSFDNYRSRCRATATRFLGLGLLYLTGHSSRITAERAAIQDATPAAAKNTTAIQACGSESVFEAIATAIVTAAIPHKKANEMQQR
jgi:hypothetical protein